ncbi:6-methyl salicylic acid synthase [Truncatella angustata]|uniref:6-methylsalicylic acid synthase n=1 Tax=Truncatella angustata TaxID=152316 RepID=A0A9P8UGB6_9PEZI|nr:6-methyl salicylic acid synthase [Truncatella angustata]KAH6651598.1 6-methyl salicylic acid synthase [Truncatella angustata]
MISSGGTGASSPYTKLSGSASPSFGNSSTSELSDATDFNANDVAVIGMACRVAGGAHSPDQLWDSIMAQRDASSEIPSWRWEPYERRDPRNVKELKNTTKRGYFLDAIENFDPAFFGISPKEAEQMDPQQRISLEVAWEALERAGVDPKSLSGSNTAVFMGVNSDDYSKLLLEDLPNVDAWMGIGTAYCGVPNRISYHLNLMGPSTAVDAACASSLVAIHHGRQAIMNGESNIAIAGGVNALLGPGLTRVLDKAGAISSDGSCLSFDDRAHGYGRGEGAAIVILKHLGNAIKDGDNIVAVLKGTAVAQDGKTNGIMAPNAKAQELVARQALEQANIDPITVQYVEAHATSTPLGDPTEVSAISAVYGQSRPKEEPVRIGSVKPNVGHLEAGAGAVGFIKAIMAIKAAQYPPQANLQKLNSKIDWEKSGTAVVQEAAEWPQPSGHPRRAAICSYGYGGTVSHAVVEQFAHDFDTANLGASKHPRGPILFVLSAPQEKRLGREALALAEWLATPVGKLESLVSIANTLALRRAQHDYRAAFVVESHEQAVGALKAFAEGLKQEWSSSSAVLGPGIKKDVVWVFSGHGAQWTDMGKELIGKNAVFYQAILPLDDITRTELGFSVIESLTNGENFDRSDRVQVLTYVIQVGLSAVLKHSGLHPSAVIGHSVGEIAATVAAGALTPEEGALIVTRRAKLYAQVQGQGAMFMVNLPFEQVRDELGEDGEVVAAIESSPSSCVVSGELDAVTTYAEKARSSGVKVMKVATDIAFHSHKTLEPLAASLRDALLGGIQPQAAEVPLYSTSNMDPRFDGVRDIDYWVTNMVRPVHLTSAVGAAIEDGYRLFLEVSSHPIVSHSINETIMDLGIDDEEFATIPTIRRNKSAASCVMQACGSLFVKGAAIDFRLQLGPDHRWSTRVPGTSWVHKPIWRKVESAVAASTANLLTHDVDKHTLLGLRNPIGGTNTILYSTTLDNYNKPFPGSHPLHGTEIVPAAVLLNTFHHATKAATLSDVTLRVPVAVSAPRDVQVVVADDTVKLISRLQQNAEFEDHSWVTHTTARWSLGSGEQAPQIDVESIKKRIGKALPSNFSINYLDKVGVSAMGFPWAVTEHYGNLKEMIARVDVAPNTNSGDLLPWDASSWAAILDAATSVGSTIFFDNPRLRMPAQIDKVYFYGEYDVPPPKVGYLYVEEASERGAPAVHVSVCDDDGRVIAKFQSMRFSEIEGTPGASGSVESLVHGLTWVAAPFAKKAAVWDNVILVSDDNAVLARSSRLQLKLKSSRITKLTSASDITSAAITPNTAIVYWPGSVLSLVDVPARSEVFLAELLSLTKHVVREATSIHNVKVFAITVGVGDADTPTALAQAPLHGLARIIASEHSDQWGALIDVDEDTPLPSMAMRYIHDQDVIRVIDDLPRVARLQPLSRDLLYSPEQAAIRTLLPKPEGTYLITGGLGALGLEVANWLVEKGARRVVLLSRRGLPPRSKWAATDADEVVKKVLALERAGATIHTVSLDIGQVDAPERLEEILNGLSLPPVLGVVHAAGTLVDQLVLETTTDAFSRVLKPKISGALTLNKVFPPGTLDWMVLFSSCGQLFGFPGQSSYASGNAFLDTLAAHRRRQGDNAVAFQWTSWRGLGMAASTDFINAELQSKGITDITVEEGFRAWEHLAKFNMDHGVVLRSLAFDQDEPLPVPILEDIVARRPAAPGNAGTNSGAQSGETVSDMPSGGPELKDWLDGKVREVISNLLMLGGADEVDGRAAIADLGVDSVLTVTLRQKLQSAFKVKVPPTLTWSHPTTNHLVGWLTEKLAKG